jgi:hypothetical protein
MLIMACVSEKERKFVSQGIIIIKDSVESGTRG